MKQFFYIPLFLLSLNSVIAQSDTTKWTYTFHYNHERIFRQPHLLKLDNPNYYNPNSFLFAALREFTDSNELQVFKDEDCTKAFSEKETKLLFYNDYIITFDPKTFEEVKYPIDDYIPFDYANRHYQLSQIWYFDTIRQQLQSTIENCAIVSFDYKEVNQTAKIDTTIQFYLHNAQLTGNWTDNWNEDNIIWKIRVSNQGRFKDKKISDHLLEKAHLKHHKLFCQDEKYQYQQVDHNFIQQHFTTWKHKANIRGEEVITIHPILEKVISYTIVQEFSFNKATKTLSSRVVAIAPNFHAYQDKFGFMQWTGNDRLFWIVYDDKYIPFLSRY